MSAYFTYSPISANTVARAADINTRFNAVSAGFDLLPPPTYIAEDRVTYSVDTGATNAYIATPPTAITAYNAGLRIRLKVANANTGPSTLNVSGLGVKQIVRSDGSALQLGDIVANQILDLTYDGTNFRLAMAFAEMSPAGVMAKIAAGGAMTVNGTASFTGAITATGGVTINGQLLDGLTATGVSIAEAANIAAVQSLLGLGSAAYQNTTAFATSGDLALKANIASPTFTGVPAAPTAAVDTNTTQLATTAFVIGQAYAKLASPTFTGTPLAPTPATADNTTKIATTAYVKAQGYAPLASPTFTGVPAGPTAASGTNTTQLATTAFVADAVATGGGSFAPLASPNFTGVPTAPTAAADTNTTQLATTAFVIGQANSTAATIAMNGAQAAGTSAKYARADHVHPTDTSRAPLASPTFTGTVTVPTPATADDSTKAASTAYVKANPASYATTSSLSAYAPLASPALTGTPTSSTAAVDTNTGQITTTAFVIGQGYAKLASPTFTGTPAAPTAAADTNTTQVATTAFVIGQANSTAGTIAMNGAQAAGTSAKYARADHVHPTDTSRAPLASPGFTGTPTAPTAANGTNTTQIATTAFVQTAVSGGGSGYAPIDSPAFTGTPTAPTASAGTNTTQLATTAFVTTADNLKANIASPALTGTPTAPTAGVDTNTGQIATTAFVINQGYAKLAGPSFTGTVQTAASAAGGAGFRLLHGVAPTTPANGDLWTTTGGLFAFINSSTVQFAPLASPTFTGTPAAPTAAVDTNTTQVATTAYVIGQGYLKSATASSTYAPLASPTFTGTPAAPTAAADTSTTQVATTAFVDRLRDVPRTTGGLARGKVFATSTGVTVGTAAAGETYSVYNDSAAAITLTASGVTMRLGGTATTGNRTLAARGMATLWYNAAAEVVVSGPGVS